MNSEAEKVISQMVPNQHEMSKAEEIKRIMEIVKHLEFFYHHDYEEEMLIGLIERCLEILNIRRKK
jgi:hypothetical protein